MAAKTALTKKPAEKKNWKTKPTNFWHEGMTTLAKMPEIAKGIRHALKNHPELKAVYKKDAALAWRLQEGGFVGLVNIIISQQISTSAAAHLTARLQEILKGDVTPKKILKLDDAAFRTLGFSRQKIAYCRDLAQKVIDKKFDPDALEHMTDEEAFESLLALKGIGTWSVEIYMMFCLGRGDVWPAGDLGIQRGLQKVLGLKERPDTDKARELGNRWAPHRSAAALIVWRA